MQNIDVKKRWLQDCNSSLLGTWTIYTSMFLKWYTLKSRAEEMHRYQNIKNLGDGTYGSVVLARNQENGETVAIKK